MFFRALPALASWDDLAGCLGRRMSGFSRFGCNADEHRRNVGIGGSRWGAEGLESLDCSFRIHTREGGGNKADGIDRFRPIPDGEDGFFDSVHFIKHYLYLPRAGALSGAAIFSIGPGSSGLHSFFDRWSAILNHSTALESSLPT
jgi:hypothetical protein